MSILDRILRRPSRKQLLDRVEHLTRTINILNEPELVDMELEPGGALRMGIKPNLGAKVLAISFAEMIGKAPNWMSYEVGPFDSYEGKLIVTVRRHGHDSPEVAVGVAKDLILDLIAHAPADASAEYRSAFDAATAFVRPIEDIER